MKRWILLSLALVAVAAGAFAYIQLGRTQEIPASPAVPRLMSVPVTRGTISRTISAQGRLEPLQDQALNFGVGGTIRAILVRPGDYVEEGAELALLDQTSATLELLRAQRNYDQAVLESIGSVIEEARLQLELAKASFEATVLRAPFSGVVASVDAIEGATVNAQNAVIRLVSRDAFKVAVDVDETELRSLSVGQEAILSVDSIPGTRLIGRVTTIGWVPSSTSGSAVYPVEIEIDTTSRPAPAPAGPAGRLQRGQVQAPAAAPPALRPGLSVTIDIVVASAENVLTVPLAAVVESGGRSAVTKVRPDGSTEVVEVQTGISDGINVAILSGLSEGDQVLMNNYQLFQTLSQSQSGNQQGNMGQFRIGAGGGLSIPLPGGQRR